MDAVVDAGEGSAAAPPPTEVTAVTVDEAQAQHDRHHHAGGNRCAARGCTERWPCWYRLDAVHILSGGQS